MKFDWYIYHAKIIVVQKCFTEDKTTDATSVEISSCNNLYKFGCAHLLIFPKKYFI